MFNFADLPAKIILKSSEKIWMVRTKQEWHLMLRQKNHLKKKNGTDALVS